MQKIIATYNKLLNKFLIEIRAAKYSSMYTSLHYSTLQVLYPSI